MLQLFERLLVILQFEFTKSQHGKGRTAFGFEASQFFECWARLSEAVAFVLQRAEVPPSFSPVGFQIWPSPLKIDGCVGLLGLPGAPRALGEYVARSCFSACTRL